MEEVAFVDKKLKLNPADSKNEWDVQNNKKIYKSSINPLLYFLKFLENNIASNIYLYQNFGLVSNNHTFTNVDKIPLHNDSVI